MFPILQFAFPTKFGRSFVFNLSREDYTWSQEKLKRIIKQNVVGKTKRIMGNVKVANTAAATSRANDLFSDL